MKLFLTLAIAIASLSCFADCTKNQAAGVSLISQVVASQLDGTAIYDDMFNVRINHTTKSGSSVLSISGLVKHGEKLVSIHGLLSCNDETGEYEFAGAGTSGN